MTQTPELIYVYLGGSATQNSSVQRKVMAQIEGLNRAGIHCEGWFFTKEVDRDTPLNEHVLLRPLGHSGKKYRLFAKQKERQFQIAGIHQVLKQDGRGAYYFLRHMNSGKAYFRMLRDLGPRIFLYIPSNTLQENYHEFRSGLSGSFAGKLIQWYEYLTRTWWNEWRFYKFITSRVRACVAFTPEFCRLISRRALRKPATAYNRDGASAVSVPVRSNRNREGVVKLLFMKGSQSVQRWAGLDRIIRSIAAGGKGRFELYITGRVHAPDQYKQPYVKLTGQLKESELTALIDEVDLGVSNLANYLICFNETTNLKSREYYMRGLPFVQANTMPDIEGTPMEDYYLNLPNNEDLIDMDRVFDFAMQMRTESNHPRIMREFAERHLDWNITAAELAAVLRKEMAKP